MNLDFVLTYLYIYIKNKGSINETQNLTRDVLSSCLFMVHDSGRCG